VTAIRGKVASHRNPDADDIAFGARTMARAGAKDVKAGTGRISERGAELPELSRGKTNLAIIRIGTTPADADGARLSCARPIGSTSTRGRGSFGSGINPFALAHL
jgi:hypothetical protein